MVMMVGPRATNNFISLKTVQQLSLLYSTYVNFGVTLGNGERIQGEGECKGVLIEVHGILLDEDVLVLELRNLDIGLQWLEKLGEIKSIGNVKS